jgi:hypothetical protein
LVYKLADRAKLLLFVLNCPKSLHITAKLTEIGVIFEANLKQSGGRHQSGAECQRGEQHGRFRFVLAARVTTAAETTVARAPRKRLVSKASLVCAAAHGIHHIVAD